MPHFDRPWNTTAHHPPINEPVEIRFSDGTFDLALWTGNSWFPVHPGKTPIAWRALPESLEHDRVA